MFKYKSNCALLIQIFEVTTIFFCRKNELFSIQMLHNYITCIVQYIMIHNQCPATSRRTQRFAKCNFFIKKLNFGGHLGRYLEFLKTFNGPEPEPNGISKSILSPSKNTKTFTIHLHARFWYPPDYLRIFIELLQNM